MRSLGFLALVFMFASSGFAAPIIVKVSFVEALALRDTTSSERFQKEFEAVIQLGKTELKSKLQGCGYQLESQTAFYDASDPLQAKERAEQAVKEGTWLIVGPRRSNHYLLLAQGAPKTPTVSLMASSSEVGALDSLHLSLSPLNAEMAQSAAREAATRVRKVSSPTYVAIVSRDCLTCGDFADHFEIAAKRLGLKESARIEITGELPSIEPLRVKIQALRPTFILLPNFSKVSAHVMAGVHDASSKSFFVGGDGWGDAQFGFVQNGKSLDTVTGMTVRGFPPVKDGLRAFPLGRRVLAEAKTLEIASSGPGLAILKVMASTADILCSAKPKSADAFRAAFTKQGRKEFRAPWGVSIYQLNHGSISYIPRKTARQ